MPFDRKGAGKALTPLNLQNESYSFCKLVWMTKIGMEDNGKYIYTVSQLTSSVKIVLEDSFQNIWVEGEVSNFDRPLSGHFFFTLKDDKSELE